MSNKIPFLGYSAKDPVIEVREHGFTAAGPYYGNAEKYYDICCKNNIPVCYQVTVDKNCICNYNEAAIIAQVEAQVQSAIDKNLNVFCWTLFPEEVRPWSDQKYHEMSFLQVVCETIRKFDDKRKIYLYNPNHRNENELSLIGKHVDILSKGAYLEATGRTRKRIWIKESVETILKAIELSGKSELIPCCILQMSQDPQVPTEDIEIPQWVKHDVYLALLSGAKMIFIWSLFARNEIKRTFNIWLTSYCQAIKEINEEYSICDILHDGKRSSKITIEPTDSKYVDWSAFELELNSRETALFIVNSENEPISLEVKSMGDLFESAYDVFNKTDFEGPTIILEAYEVLYIKVTYKSE